MSKRAQSTLEYVIILTAIIAAILVFANVVLKSKVSSTLNNIASKMENKVSSLNFGR